MAGAGRGLFAVKEFKMGEYIALYTGDVLSDGEVAERYTNEASKTYVLETKAGKNVDARSTRTHVGRYANHKPQSQANAALTKPGAGTWADEHHFGLVKALKRIQGSKAEPREIFVNYGRDYWRGRGKKRDDEAEESEPEPEPSAAQRIAQKVVRRPAERPTAEQKVSQAENRAEPYAGVEAGAGVDAKDLEAFEASGGLYNPWVQKYRVDGNRISARPGFRDTETALEQEERLALFYERYVPAEELDERGKLLEEMKKHLPFLHDTRLSQGRWTKVKANFEKYLAEKKQKGQGEGASATPSTAFRLEKIYEDGNCLQNSVLQGCRLVLGQDLGGLDHKDLRKMVLEEFEQHADKYRPWGPEDWDKQLAYLKRSGRFDSDLWDLAPHAISNLLGVRLVIHDYPPVPGQKPAVVGEQFQPTLHLRHRTTPPQHYDLLVPMSGPAETAKRILGRRRKS
jgi:hypothetical protein